MRKKSLHTMIADLMEARREELQEHYKRSPLYLECVIREHDATCAKLGKLLLSDDLWSKEVK